MSNKCKNKPHKWTKWDFAGYKNTGGAIEYRRCKRCGAREHREIRYVAHS